MQINHQKVLEVMAALAHHHHNKGMDIICAGGYPLSMVSGVETHDVDIFITYPDVEPDALDAGVQEIANTIGSVHAGWNYTHIKSINAPQYIELEFRVFNIPKTPYQLIFYKGGKKDYCTAEAAVFSRFDFNINRVALDIEGNLVIDPKALKDLHDKVLTGNPSSPTPTNQRLNRLAQKFPGYVIGLCWQAEAINAPPPPPILASMHNAGQIIDPPLAGAIFPAEWYPSIASQPQGSPEEAVAEEAEMEEAEEEAEGEGEPGAIW